MKFSINDFFSKYEQIPNFLQFVVNKIPQLLSPRFI